MTPVEIPVKISVYVLPVSILIALSFTGCKEIASNFADVTNSVEQIRSDVLVEQTVNQPAVLIASTHQQPSLFDSVFPSENKKSKLKGIDHGQPFVACIWLSEKGSPEPVLYVPVNDYEKFVSSLAKKYVIKSRGIATKFRSGRRHFYVTQGDGHAKVTRSLDDSRSVQDSPSDLLPGLPTESGFVFKWSPNSLNQKQAKPILVPLHHLVGESFAQLLSLDSSLVFSLEADGKELASGVDVNMTNVPENVEGVRTQLEEKYSLANWSMPDSAQAELSFRIEENENQNNVSGHLKSSSTALFKGHLVGLKKKRTRALRGIGSDTNGGASSLGMISSGLGSAKNSSSFDRDQESRSKVLKHAEQASTSSNQSGSSGSSKSNGSSKKKKG